MRYWQHRKRRTTKFIGRCELDGTLEDGGPEDRTDGGAAGRSACSDHWKDEVLLHDGGKIAMDRRQAYGGWQEGGQSLPIMEQAHAFSMPGNGARLSL